MIGAKSDLVKAAQRWNIHARLVRVWTFAAILSIFPCNRATCRPSFPFFTRADRSDEKICTPFLDPCLNMHAVEMRIALDHRHQPAAAIDHVAGAVT